MRAVLSQLRTGHRGLWVSLVATIAFVSLFSLLIPSTFKAMVDRLLPQGNARHFHLFCALVLLLVLNRVVLNALQDYLFLRLRQLIEKDLLGHYFESVIHLPLARMLALGEGDLVSRISLILTHFQQMLPELVYYCAYALCVSLAVMGVLYLVNPLFLLVSLGFLLLHVANFRLHYRLSRQFSTEYASLRGQLADASRDLLRGRKLITLSGLEQPLLEGLEQDNRALYQAALRRDMAESGLALWQQLLQGVAYLTLVTLGALAMFDESLSAGDLALSLLLMTFAYEPVYRLSRLTKALSEADAQFERVLPLLSPPTPRTAGGAEPSHIESLELRGLTFEREGRELLREVDYRFLPGNIYVIAGPSGTGKTTLLHLLTGLLRPTRGRVLCNGREVGTQPAAELAALMTYCPQQSLLLDGSVQDNVTLFASEPNHGRLAEALRQAAADSFISLERAAHMQVENEGANFSGGQRQRLHLARAWYHPAPVMLFDEPTANLDADNEELFFQRLASATAGRILLVISHSPAAWRHASQVLRLTGGTLQPVERASAQAALSPVRT